VSTIDETESDILGSHAAEVQSAPGVLPPKALDAALVESLSWQPLARLGAAQVKTLLRTPDSVAGLLRLEPGTSENTHVHADAHHHGWVVRGEATVAGTELTAGSYFHIPAGVRHAVTDVGPEGCEIFFVYQFPAAS
jgi:quercetin dioxygenase-like cupin family protein